MTRRLVILLAVLVLSCGIGASAQASGGSRPYWATEYEVEHTVDADRTVLQNNGLATCYGIGEKRTRSFEDVYTYFNCRIDFFGSQLDKSMVFEAHTVIRGHKWFVTQVGRVRWVK